MSKESLAKVKELYNEFAIYEKESSDLILEAKKNKHNQILLVRRDKTQSEVTEGALWDEVRYLGQETEAYEVLKKRYPDVFEKSELANKKAEEINVFCAGNFGFNPFALKFVDIINIIEGIIEIKLEK